MADAADDDSTRQGGSARGLTERAPEADPDEADPDEPDPDEPEVDEDEDEPSAGARVLRFLAGVLAAGTLVGGLTWILINLQAPEPLVDVLVGVVLAVGGLILLMPHRARLPRRAAWLTAGVTGLVGSAAGALYHSAYLCCSFAYVEQRGFPFRWLSHGATAEDRETARRLAAGSDWHADVPTLAVNVIVWAYAGIVVLAMVSALRRRRR
jgi:hypothetical protein